MHLLKPIAIPPDSAPPWLLLQPGSVTMPRGMSTRPAIKFPISLTLHIYHKKKMAAPIYGNMAKCNREPLFLSMQAASLLKFYAFPALYEAAFVVPMPPKSFIFYTACKFVGRQLPSFGLPHISKRPSRMVSHPLFSILGNNSKDFRHHRTHIG